MANSDTSDDSLVCKPKAGRKSDSDSSFSSPEPEKKKAKRGTKKVVTVETVKEATAEGDAYVAGLLGAPVVDASGLLFCIISKSRWANAKTVEARLLGGGLDASKILWIVGAGEADEYEAAGCKGKVVEGGGLCASRNFALDEARRQGCACVEMSDDLKKCEIVRAGDALADFHDEGRWTKPKDLKAANAAGANKVEITPVAGAAMLLALLRATDRRLAGCYPNANPGLAAGVPPVGDHHFIVGDFLVIDVQRTELRFDERLMLKEDYDYTAQHMHEYGAVCRSNRVLCLFEHYTNAGGAVDVRSDAREQHAIQLIHHKWPGAFRKHGTRGANEIQFCWDQRDKSLGGKKDHERVPPPEGLPVEPIERKPKGGQKTLTSFFKKK